LAGHPWIFANEFDPPGGVPPGVELEVKDARGRFVGRGYYNPASQIAIRLFTRRPDETMDAAFFRERIAQARTRRRRFLPEDEPRREIFSEGDHLPGVIVDAYGRFLVLQILTLGIEARRDLLIEALIEAYAPEGILERSDASARVKEGLTPRVGVIHGAVPDRIETAVDGVRFLVRPAKGHKTGAYLDQRPARRRFAAFAAGANVLDAFAYHGLFACYAATAGARSVTAIEASAEACDDLRENAALNERAVEIAHGNAFDLLRRFEEEGRRFDLISLDPPSFTRAADRTGGARRGYKEINIRALRLLAPGGLLFSSSCSYHMGREPFLRILGEAAHDAGRDVRLLELLGASPDHPALLVAPETDYLKCAVIQAA
jgi:23S rRNA (cytosine1962-C5)-methyltransferase